MKLAWIISALSLFMMSVAVAGENPEEGAEIQVSKYTEECKAAGTDSGLEGEALAEYVKSCVDEMMASPSAEPERS